MRSVSYGNNAQYIREELWRAPRTRRLARMKSRKKASPVGCDSLLSRRNRVIPSSLGPISFGSLIFFFSPTLLSSHPLWASLRM